VLSLGTVRQTNQPSPKKVWLDEVKGPPSRV
jgi:hypothetical protein